MPGTGSGPHVVSWPFVGSKNVSVTIVKDGCTATLPVAKITVAPPPFASIAAPATTCQFVTDTVKFTGLAPSGATYQWDFDFGDTVRVPGLVETFLVSWPTPGVKNIKLRVLVGALCVSNDAVASVEVKPKPTAPVTETINYCERSGDKTIALKNTPTPVWYTTATGGAPLLSPPTISTATAPKTVIYYAGITDLGCSSDRTPINVNVVNRSSAVVTYAGPYCKNDPNNALPGGSFVPGGVFSALTAGLIFKDAKKGLIDLTATPARSGNYTIRYISPGNCPDTGTVAVRINPLITSGFSYANKSYCQDAANPTAKLDAGATAGTYSATPDGLIFIDDKKGIINLTASRADTYTITNTIETGNCIVKPFAVAELQVIATPTANFDLAAATCKDADVVITTEADKIANATYNWSYGVEGKSSHKVKEYGKSFKVQWNTFGVKTITYSVANGICASTPVSKTIEVLDRPEAAISTSITPAIISLEENKPIQFNPAVSYGDSPIEAKSYLWDFGDGTISQEVSPSHQFGTDGTYVVTLLLANGENCQSTATTPVTLVNTPILEPPTAFSPNGDGTYDRFVPTVGGVKVTSFQVFDRWGGLIYDAGDDVTGWDGTDKKKSAIVPNGLYVYILKGTPLGDAKKEMVKAGTITVVK